MMTFQVPRELPPPPPPPIPATQQGSHSQPPHSPRPSSAPSFGSFGSSAQSISEQFQLPSHIWRYVHPASLLWGSQSVEYMEQYDQQSFQHPSQRILSFSSTSSAAAATAHHNNHPSVYCPGLCCPGTEGPAQLNPSQ